MKPTPANWQSLVHCLRIVARDGTTIRLAEYPHDLPMSNGQLYQADYGYEFTGLSAQGGSAPAVMDLTGLLAAAGVSRDGLAAGKWDNAELYLFATSWAAPVEGEEPMAKFLFGKTEVRDHNYTTEMMHIIDSINQPVGREETALCPWTLFDETLDGKVLPYEKSRCSGPRADPDGPQIGDYTETGSITSVTDRHHFADSSRTEPDDYFAKGQIKFTSGDNAGLPALTIKSWDADTKTFETHDAAHYPVQADDEYQAIPGCRLRRTQDCAGKFNNAINFGGCDTVPTQETMTKIGGVN